MAEWEEEGRLKKEAEEERKRKAAERKAESDRASREYWSKVWAGDEPQADEGSMGWFTSLLRQRTVVPEAVRLTKYPEMAAEYLAKAYRVEVERMGGTFSADAYTRRAIVDVARWLTTHTKPGLMLRGYVGVGKTTVMRAAAQVLAIVEGRTMKIVDARDIAAAAKADERRFKEYADAPLLGLDDLGTEPSVVKSYGNELSPVAELLTRRYAARRFTVITTNLAAGDDGDELRDVYGDRLFDRIREMFNIITYDAKQKSYRQ